MNEGDESRQSKPERGREPGRFLQTCQKFDQPETGAYRRDDYNVKKPSLCIVLSNQRQAGALEEAAGREIQNVYRKRKPALGAKQKLVRKVSPELEGKTGK